MESRFGELDFIVDREEISQRAMVLSDRDTRIMELSSTCDVCVVPNVAVCVHSLPFYGVLIGNMTCNSRLQRLYSTARPR